jgi:putative membrane protein
MMTGFGMGFVGLFGLLFIFLFFGGLILLAAWAAKSVLSTGGPSQPTSLVQGPNAREILDQRYARGEITREQYELMKQDLQ